MMRKWPLLIVWIALLAGASRSLGATASYDLREMTPEVQTALQGRQARYAELQRLKSESILGEDNRGFVKMLRESTEARGVAQTENQDREVIYRAIVDQNQLGPDGMTQVQQVFAEVQRGKAKSGDLIQLRSGEWVQK